MHQNNNNIKQKVIEEAIHFCLPHSHTYMQENTQEHLHPERKETER